MAKKSSVQKNLRRAKLVERFAERRAALASIARDNSYPAEERFAARLKLAKLPRNSAKVRLRNRCGLTGRPRGNYRKFKISRIAFRELALQGQLPGVVKSSW